RFDLPKNRLGNRQPHALDLSGALTLSAPRTDTVELPEPHFSLMDDFKSELHLLAHAGLLGAKEKPCSDLHRHALHAIAKLMDKPQLHTDIEGLRSEFHAGLLLLEHEAEFVKSKTSGTSS